MSFKNEKPCCDGRENCETPISRIDQKGFIYCENHKPLNRTSRKLRSSELKKINLNQSIKYELIGIRCHCWIDQDSEYARAFSECQKCYGEGFKNV